MARSGRFKDIEFDLRNESGNIPWDRVPIAAMWDLRDLLTEIRDQNARLLAIVECRNFTNIPMTLSRIARNTSRHRCLNGRCPRAFDTARGLAQHERAAHK